MSFPADYYDRDLEEPAATGEYTAYCRNETCEREFYPRESDADQPNAFCSRACEIEEREAEA